MANGKVYAHQTIDAHAHLARFCGWEYCATVRDDRWWPSPPWVHNHPVGGMGLSSMTTYNKRALRAAGMFAGILFGVGLLLVMVTFFDSVGLGQAKGSIDLVSLWILAGLFLWFGTVLNWKVRQLVRNKGREPEDYEGVLA